jgi:uncharacterized protein (DUF433 family)
MATTRAANEAVDIDDKTLDQMIAYHYHSRDRAYLADYGTPVWVVINYLQGANWDFDKVAKAYELPEIAVRAAVHYYEKNRKFIDAHILLQSEENTV